MSILTELKKLTKKKNATVVSQALPDSLDGSGSSGGSGILVVHESLDATYNEGNKFVLDKTTDEVVAAIENGYAIIRQDIDELGYVNVVVSEADYDGSDAIALFVNGSNFNYQTDESYPYRIVTSTESGK